MVEGLEHSTACDEACTIHVVLEETGTGTVRGSRSDGTTDRRIRAGDIDWDEVDAGEVTSLQSNGVMNGERGGSTQEVEVMEEWRGQSELKRLG